MQNLKSGLLLLALCCFVSACAKAPVENASSGETQAGETAPIKSTDVVKVTPQEANITPGETADALVTLQISNGYHVNANPPSFAYLKATELQIAPADGIAVEFITYPNPLTKKFAFSEQPLAVYEGETLVKARLKADKSSKAGRHNLSAKLRVQACDDKVCYAPGTLDLSVPVNIK